MRSESNLPRRHKLPKTPAATEGENYSERIAIRIALTTRELEEPFHSSQLSMNSFPAFNQLIGFSSSHGRPK